MRFDVRGSSLRLDDFKVVGETASHRQPDWHARIQVQEAELRWQKPMQLEMKAGVTVKDSRPFIAIFDNVRGEHGWLSELATVEDLAGHLELTLDAKRALVRDAMLGSDKINIGVKGLADRTGREAMVYARYGNLTGAMQVQGDAKNYHLINARSRFDAYVPGKTSLPHGADEAMDPSPGATSTKESAERSTPAKHPGAATRIRGHAPSSKAGVRPAEHGNLFLDGDL